MTKTVSARIDNAMHKTLVDRCNIVGCSINGYLKGCTELALTGTTECDLGDMGELECNNSSNTKDKDNAAGQQLTSEMASTTGSEGNNQQEHIPIVRIRI